MSLTSQERMHIKRAIFDVVESAAVVSPIKLAKQSEKHSVKHAAKKTQHLASPYSINFASVLFGHGFRRVSLVVMPAFIFFITGGAIFAAEGTIPGDALYKVKLNINEKIVSSFAVSPKSRAEVEASFAERRLKEIEKIALKPNPSSKDIQELTTSFEQHAQKYHDNVKLVEEEDGSSEAAKVGSDFKVILDAHGKILASVASSSASTDLQEDLQTVSDTVSAQDTKTEEFIDAAQVKADAAEIAAPEPAIDPALVEERIGDLKIKIDYLKAFRSRVNVKAIAQTEKLHREIVHMNNGKTKAKRQMKLLDEADQVVEEALLIREVEEDLDIDIHATSTPASSVTASTTLQTATSTYPFATSTASTTITVDFASTTATTTFTISSTTPPFGSTTLPR